MESKNIIQELAGYRVKVERNGKEVVNVPGFLCLPGLLAAPRLGIVGMIAAPLLGLNVHLENGNGKTVDVGNEMKKAAETAVNAAKEGARTIKEEIDKAWEAVSAEDPEAEEAPESEESPDAEDAGEDPAEEDEPAAEPETGDVPEIQVDPDDSDKA